MYHPFGETGAQDEHEFVELYNAGSGTADLGGYKLLVDGSERLTLPLSTKLAAREYLVLAKNAAALLQEVRYALDAERVIGDYTGELDNGGAEVSLLNPLGTVIDSVKYDDAAPWPLGADAFGAKPEFLPGLAPFDAHRFIGHSLERVDFTSPSSAPWKWEASGVDQATPGRPNGAVGAGLVVVSRQVTLEGTPDSAVISPDLPVQISFQLAGNLASGNLTEAPLIEFRSDVLGMAAETSSMLPLQRIDERNYRVVLPGAAGDTVVRYRVRASSAADSRVLGPRRADPNAWYAYFVEPDPDSAASGRGHRMFIAPDNWTQLWQNISPGMNTGCTMNPSWDAEVPAVFVSGGNVYDVLTRYQGSYNRRKDGIEIANFTAPAPTAPSPLLALSFHIRFPNYAEYDGENSLNLNKLKQACPGVLNALEGALFEQAKIPAQSFKFARLYVNGGYYNYGMEVRSIETSTMRAYEGKGNPVGLLFKADGASGRGPLGLANFTPLAGACSASALDRYQRTYELKTHEELLQSGEAHAELISLIEELDRIQATSDSDPTVRAYFERNFDVSEVATQFAIRNWAGVWDDGFHNFWLYKRGSDGKWIILPQDFDCDFGGDPVQCADLGKFYNSPTLSFFHPEQGDGVTAVAISRLKTQFIRAFRPEFSARVIELGTTLFSESNIDATLERILSTFDMAAWDASPSRYCDVNARVQQARDFLAERRAFLAQGIQ
ncbi:MAG TPA: CotH kinase family protein [Polyangiaceae bacterium]|nr:CotH kinase family protein [Polyangiaceae bacterium]